MYSEFYCTEHKGKFKRMADTEPRTYDGRVVCEDCYFDLLGRLIEDHPIGVFPSKNPTELDCSYNSEIMCPYCGESDSDSWEVRGEPDEERQITCGYCEREFLFTRSLEVTYSSRKIEEIVENGKDERL